ncbi:MAG: ATP-binding cassette domain-containing protein [Chlorobi bacterium]|nr:ATP-binding cassette domain-containing protein [Chlorobiota bacterium]
MEFFIKRKVFVSMLFIGLTFLGYVSYKQLPVELLPNVELPVMIVRVDSRQELTPAYIENQAIIPLEGAIGTLENIESIESYADYRSGTIFITYSGSAQTKYAYLKLYEKIDEARSRLPDNFTVNVIKINTEQMTNQFMDLQVRGGGGVDRVRNIVDKYITPELESIDGIANVQATGGREKSVKVILDEEAVDAFGLTPAKISSIINQNQFEKRFVGKVDQYNRRYFVNVSAENRDISQLENIIVKNSGQIKLKDVADIFFGTKEEESYSRVNGKDAVTIQLARESQVNLIELSHKVKSEIDKLNAKFAGQDIAIVVQRNSAEEMEESIDTIINLAMTGALLAIIVLWLFLRNFRLIFSVGLAIPVSVFTAFNFFYTYNISINSLTLIGIALSIGMLLDNSVVVLENIYRLAEKEKDATKAVARGTKEVWRSIFAATLTTVTVFLPFLFSSNFLVSELGLNIGVSVVSTLIISLFIALLFIPMITHYFLTKKNNRIKFHRISGDNRLMRIYLVLLKASMRFPARTIITSVIIFFAAVFIALAISVNVTQETETASFSLYVENPQGTTLEKSDQIVKSIEEKLADIKEKEDVISNIRADESTVTIKLKKDYKDLDNRSIEDIKEDIQNKVNGIRSADISFEPPSSNSRFRSGAGANMGRAFQRMLGVGQQTEKVVIKGNDFQRMEKVAEDIQYYLDNLSSVNFARVSASGTRPEIHILFDQTILAKYDIPLSSIVSELATFNNQFSSNTVFKSGTDSYDITIQTGENEKAEKTIDDLRKIKIFGGGGSIFDLRQIARFIYSGGMSSIYRMNQEKQIEVSYSFLSEVNDSKELLESARNEVDELVAALTLPAGIAVEVVHDDNPYDEYYFLIAVAALLIYMILASVFESLLTPLILMFSIPLAAIGALAALIFTGNSLLNTNTLTGFLILLGIVVNNGIILIDYSNNLRKRGFTTPRALVTAGLARVRPILITAVTTIVAMIPLAMGQVQYVAEIGAPFAITVIGGLSVSTLFTLILIPTMYSGLESALQWFKNLSLNIKLFQFATLLILSYLIYADIDSFIWRLADLFLVLISIPALTYFIQNSLRQANANLIGDNEPITIKIRNVVKIYDLPSRFVREWKRGKNQSTENGGKNNLHSLLENFIWQTPLLLYMIYFTYFYLESSFWNFVLIHILFFFALALLKRTTIAVKSFNYKKQKRWLNLLTPLFYWGFPFFNIVYFYFNWDSLFGTGVIAFLWFGALLIYSTSQKLTDKIIESVNDKNLTGKIKIRYYRFVLVIPVIGKKKEPFKALDKVSLEIGNGMFGLLGPNGAGKTTLMRIICGIFEQSYGAVTINGVDRNKYREELQGLIGYLPQEFGMYENMTAYEFLDYQAILKGLIDAVERKKRISETLESVRMFEHKDEKIGSFSGGMKQRIGIAQILLHLPRILVVDEPTAGLDPRERIRFRNLLVELSRERIVIFSTHIIEDISSSCNRVAVLNDGKVRYLGEPINMTKAAEGKVWTMHVEPQEFPETREKLMVVHHMRDGDKIKLRCISETQPAENAYPVKATLEDAYLYLQTAGVSR